MFDVCRLPFADCCLMFGYDVSFLLLVVIGLMRVVCWLLIVVCCVLRCFCCGLFVVC